MTVNGETENDEINVGQHDDLEKYWLNTSARLKKVMDNEQRETQRRAWRW